MLTMQEFYDLLFSDNEEREGDMEIVARLAEANLEDVAEFEAQEDWTPW